MARNLKLLLTETVDSLGIVGDVVNVRTGYARNFLLPRRLATQPSEEAVKALASKRADAERMIAEQRTKRAEIAKKLEGFELSLIRPCNDQGILYGAVTQQEISKALHDKGYEVRPRDVRLPHAIKRVDNYEIHIKFEAELEAVIKLHVLPDRELDLEDQRHREPEPVAAPVEEAAADQKTGEPGAKEKPKKGKGDKGEHAEKGEKGEHGAKGEKGGWKVDKGDAAKPEKKGKAEAEAADAPKDKKSKKGDKAEKSKKE